VHVHLATGIHGVVHRRIRPYPLSHEPLFHIDPMTSSRIVVLAVKRGIDIGVSVAAMVISLPVLVVAAVAIKLGDGGPILLRQERIGRSGHPFGFYKLRTMWLGADQRLGEILDRNARLDGPLFKDDTDPRRTPVGRVLEAMSIDELPQLWNVLCGDMSLVGPRPALPHEVAQFDAELLARHTVRPGITGLWQIEGRDNPNFQTYRRLDLIYVNNLSLWLDILILSKTLQSVIARAVHKLLKLRHRPKGQVRVGVRSS
jgi:lipopolysaccharide/colanic/teichoic acid biosynthesis glycosyltransferase